MSEDIRKMIDKVKNFKQLINENVFPWDMVTSIIYNKQNAKIIRDLLIEMFPNAKEIINYQYNDELGQPFAEWRVIIYEINNYILTGPENIDSNRIKLDQETISNRQEKYNQYINSKDSGKIVKYFRDNYADPRTIDFTKLPPVTLLDKGGYFESIDGAHRIFLAQMSKKPLKAYVWKRGKNLHPNVLKIQSLFKEKQ